jgi:hypothetical protein
MSHDIVGRDPRSPSTGPFAYTPVAAPPVTINSPITAPLSGTATVNVTNHVDVTGLVSTIMAQVKGEITGTLTGLMSGFRTGAGNSSAGFDGRSAPSTPDGSTMHGGH